MVINIYTSNEVLAYLKYNHLEDLCSNFSLILENNMLFVHAESRIMSKVEYIKLDGIHQWFFTNPYDDLKLSIFVGD